MPAANGGLENKMSNTTKRILTSIAMLVVAMAATYFGLVQWLAIAIALGMCAELAIAQIKSKRAKAERRNLWRTACDILIYAVVVSYLALFVASAYFIGGKPWIMLLTLMTICAADIGAWFFGRRIGGDKMWERLSPGKTWAGQIAGIICGTFAAVMYGLLGTDAFLSSLMWIGLGVSLLSQYGDLAASAVKRRFGIKDFGNYLPGHGGLMDRFDGWIFVMPIIWLATI